MPEQHHWNLKGGWPQEFGRDPRLSLPENIGRQRGRLLQAVLLRQDRG